MKPRSSSSAENCCRLALAHSVSGESSSLRCFCTCCFCDWIQVGVLIAGFMALNYRRIFILLLLSPQLIHLHLCGFPNYFSCSNRCGGPYLHLIIRLSPRAKDCRTHLFRLKQKIVHLALMKHTLAVYYFNNHKNVNVHLAFVSSEYSLHERLNPTAQIKRHKHSLLQLRHTLSQSFLRASTHLFRLSSSSTSRTVG